MVIVEITDMEKQFKTLQIKLTQSLGFHVWAEI